MADSTGDGEVWLGLLKTMALFAGKLKTNIFGHVGSFTSPKRPCFAGVEIVRPHLSPARQPAMFAVKCLLVTVLQSCKKVKNKKGQC